MSDTLTNLWFLQNKIREGFMFSMEYDKDYHPKWTAKLSNSIDVYSFNGHGPMRAINGLVMSVRNHHRKSK